jgi:dihydrofolate reductase
MRVSLVVAAARNGAIGLLGDLPWRLPDDQRFFKTVTLGHCVIMGRDTYDSLPRPLPDRRNFVLTSRPHADRPDVEFFTDLSKALARARELGDDECFIAGGENVYREGLEVADRIYLTRVEAEPEGDTFFPEIDPSRWRCVERRPHAPDERHAHAFVFETWERVD